MGQLEKMLRKKENVPGHKNYMCMNRNIMKNHEK